MDYAQAALAQMKETNREELQRMEAEGTLDQFMKDLDRDYQDQEALIVRQMTEENLPEDYLEKVQTLNQARSVAREVCLNDLREFLESCQEQEPKADTEERQYQENRQAQLAIGLDAEQMFRNWLLT